MRILTISHYSAYGGGIEVIAQTLCERFHALGHEARWVASESDKLPQSNIIEIIPVRCFDFIERAIGLPIPIPSFAAIRRLWRAVRSSDAVIIHDSLYINSILAMLAARLLGKSTVLIQHIADLPLKNAILRNAVKLSNVIVTRTMLKIAGQVVYICVPTQEAFADVATKTPPLFLFYGVDSEVFYFDPNDKGHALRSRLGIPADKKLCMFAGRFVAKKGMSVLAELTRLRPDLHFVLAGLGPVDPASWGLSNVTVRYDVPRHLLAEFYRAADVFILPSVGEGYPLVIQEAMTCGLPVICGSESARADPGAGRWLRGMHVALDQSAETARIFSDAIDTFVMDNRERAAMADYAAQTYRWEKMVSGILAALEAQCEVATALVPQERWDHVR